MLYVQGTDTLEVICSSAASISILSSFTTAASTGLTSPVAGSTKFNQAAAATVASVIPAPGASNTSKLKAQFISNKDASLSIDITVQINSGGTLYQAYKTTLAPGQALNYVEGVGYFVASNVAASRLLSSLEGGDSQRIFASRITEGGTFLTISGTAYYVYMGRAVQDITVKFVEFHITTAGAGTDTKEVGLFSTPAPPNKSTQTLTKIAATGTVDSGVSTGAKRNTASFSQLISAGTHLWAAYRGALATTQITTVGLANDMGQGHVLTTTGGGALTGVTTAAGTIPAVGTATIAPALRVTMD
jgi:hypothetical protein